MPAWVHMSKRKRRSFTKEQKADAVNPASTGEVINEQLGETLEWDRVVQCVINGLTFSLPGGFDRTYVYDASCYGLYHTINCYRLYHTIKGTNRRPNIFTMNLLSCE